VAVQKEGVAMTEFEEESSGVNVWIGFADLFAGLMLVMLMGLVVVLSKHKLEDVKFSNDLLGAMNKATEVTSRLRASLQEKLPPSGSQTQYSETQIVIPANALFASFGYDDYLRDPAKRELLTAIRSALLDALNQAGEQRRSLHIIIEGHTDSNPIKPSAITPAIPTNWELSSRRATGVLRFFEDGGLGAAEYNIVAMGLADTQPVASNDTEEGRSQNRRIVIRVEPDLERFGRAGK
jgi:outer membrane protein OmpA-like peptidoglycan-associated protein